MERKKLTRSSRNNVIGGVCAGLGEYFDIDPIIFRVILIALALGGGVGVILYLVLWIAIPDEDSYAYSQRAQNRQNATTASEYSQPCDGGTSAESAAGEQPQNEETKRTEKNNANAYIIGICFIVIGAFFLLNNFFHISFSKLWPIVLIVAGVVMITGYLQKTKR